jgi:hypothetical protein
MGTDLRQLFGGGKSMRYFGLVESSEISSWMHLGTAVPKKLVSQGFSQLTFIYLFGFWLHRL